MTNDESWKKNDTSDPRYKRMAVISFLLCAVLGLVGGLFLGLKISGAEEAAEAAAQERAKQPPPAESPLKQR
mgnify:CR=1 FL=1